MKYKIFLDTNRLYNQNPINEPFNENVRDLIKFIDEHNLRDVNICLPKIVIRERIQQKLDMVGEILVNFNKLSTSLCTLGHKIKQIKPLKNYRRILEKKAEDYIFKNKIVVIPPPSISKEQLIDRAINKMKPFDDNCSGFKDTLIYLSIVEDALNPKTSVDRYIFCTEDGKQFNNEIIQEFNTTTKKELFISSNTTKIIEKLDELIPLGLHLEDRNRKLKNLVLKNIGEIMHSINKLDSEKRWNSFSGIHSVIDRYKIANVDRGYTLYNRYPLGESDQDDLILGYNYKDINFVEFSEVSNNKYLIEAKLDTIIKYKDNQDSLTDDNISITTCVRPILFNPLREITKLFSMKIECDLENDTISSIHVNVNPFLDY